MFFYHPSGLCPDEMGASLNHTAEELGMPCALWDAQGVNYSSTGVGPTCLAGAKRGKVAYTVLRQRQPTSQGGDASILDDLLALVRLYELKSTLPAIISYR